MAYADNHDRVSSDATVAKHAEPPYSALFPNLDNVSPSAFRKGTLSRRRIKIAVAILGVAAALAVGLIVFSDLLFGQG